MTRLLYLDNMAMLQAPGRILSVHPEAKAVVLDQTPFYVQGGGQPSDKGALSIAGRTFSVEAVKMVNGTVLHYLEPFDNVLLKAGEQVQCSVDPVVRDLNTRAHSAGHLLDHATEDLDLDFQVRGAYHFLPGPYVEYRIADERITIDQAFLAQLAEALQAVANKIVAEAIPVDVYIGNVHDLPTWRQELIPSTVRESGKVRLVRFCREGLEPIPCSGTHVSNSVQIRPISIKRISQDKKDKRTIRVSYLLQ